MTEHTQSQKDATQDESPEAPKVGTLRENLEKAFEYLDMPGKLLGYSAAAYTFAYLVLGRVFGWLPVFLIYTAWSIFLIVGFVIATAGFFRLPKRRWWIPLVVLIITGVFGIVVLRLVPPSLQLKVFNPLRTIMQGESPPPPLSVIESVAKGSEYPGGGSFKTRVQNWRTGDGYPQKYTYFSNRLSPNRFPRSISLKDEAFDAVIGVYVFSDWAVTDKVGFDGKHKQVELPAADEFGQEYFIVVFVFPLSEEAADRLKEASPDDILAY